MTHIRHSEAQGSVDTLSSPTVGSDGRRPPLALKTHKSSSNLWHLIPAAFEKRHGQDSGGGVQYRKQRTKTGWCETATAPPVCRKAHTVVDRVKTHPLLRGAHFQARHVHELSQIGQGLRLEKNQKTKVQRLCLYPLSHPLSSYLPSTPTIICGQLEVITQIRSDKPC